MKSLSQNETERKSNEGGGRVITPADAWCTKNALTQEQLPAKAAEIEKGLRVFVGPGEVVEPRILGKRPFGRVRSGYFDDERLVEMANAPLGMSGEAEGVNFTLNPVMPALIARCINRVGESGECDATSGANSERRKSLLIDVDPMRPSGTSASEDEKTNAWTGASKVRQFLTDRGWPAPIVADSGNGYHLLCGVNLPADDGLVKRLLAELASRSNDEGVSIDKQVHNQARIVKLYGTKARRGDDTQEWPRGRKRL